MREFERSDNFTGCWNLWKADSNDYRELLTVALFAISTKFKARVTHTAEGSQHVDAAMGTLGTARTALINVYMRKTINHTDGPEQFVSVQKDTQKHKNQVSMRKLWWRTIHIEDLSVMLLYKVAQHSRTHTSRGHTETFQSWYISSCPLWLQISNPTLLAKRSFLSGPEGPGLLRFILQQRQFLKQTHTDVNTNSSSSTSESLSEIWPHTPHTRVHLCHFWGLYKDL